MGVHGLQIGINLGGAQEFQGNPGLQAFTNLLAQKQLERERERQQIVQQMGQLKPGDLRNDADRQVYYDKYNDWKNSAIQAQNEQNPSKKMDLQGQALSKYNELGGFVGESKKRGALENGLANQFMQDNFRHQFTDDAVNQFVKSRQLAVNDPNLVNTDLLSRQPDHQKVEDAYDAANQAALKQQEWSNPISTVGRDKQGNKTGVIVHNERSVDPADLLTYQKHMYDINRDVAASIDQRYGNIQGSNPEETKMMRVRQAAIDRGDLVVGKHGELQSGINEKTKPEFKTDWRPRAPTINVYAGSQPGQLALPAENEEGKTIGTLSSPNYLGMSKQGVNMAGVPSINMQTMQPDAPLKSSNKYNLVGITSAPTLNKDLYHNGTIQGKPASQKIPKGSIAQNNYATRHPEDVKWDDYAHVQEDMPADDSHPKPYTVDHLVPMSLLPRSVTGTKAWKQQTAAFKSFRGDGASRKVTEAQKLGL